MLSNRRNDYAIHRYLRALSFGRFDCVLFRADSSLGGGTLPRPRCRFLGFRGAVEGNDRRCAHTDEILANRFKRERQTEVRVIIPPVQGGWSEPAPLEGELTASRGPEHSHSDYNFVIEGQFFVESGAATIEEQTGDIVRVPARAVGRYRAPKYARLLAIYGPSKGGASRTLGYEKLGSR